MIFDKYKNSYKTAKNVMKIKMNIHNDDNIYTKHVYKRKNRYAKHFFSFFTFFIMKSPIIHVNYDRIENFS